MARKFLYIVAIIVVLFIAGAFILRIFGEDLAEVVFVPSTEFQPQEVLEDNIYADISMWYARPEITKDNPALWLPKEPEADEAVVEAKKPLRTMPKRRKILFCKEKTARLFSSSIRRHS